MVPGHGQTLLITDHRTEGAADEVSDVADRRNYDMSCTTIGGTAARAGKQGQRYEFGPRSIELSRFILRLRSRGLCTMAIFEAVGEQYPDLSFRDYWGGHALADCIEGDSSLVLVPARGRA
jgi:hypothetical protein